ncbi:MAG TPA: SpoIIE family protein phosphatase [Mucilaginibacter sp.]|nr:SpoIIE family protein phosphatase [Mucilaginibacter sp.]
MVDATHTSYNASERSYYAIIKKEAHTLAVGAGFEARRVAELDIIIAELTSNLNKYADQGEILLGHFRETDNEYIEIICIDDGPGIGDPNKMIKDGFSSTNTLGHGLGSIKRLSDKLDIYSMKGWGTIVLSRVYKAPQAKTRVRSRFEARAIVVSKPGEQKSGDGYYCRQEDKVVKLMLADGLGHGPDANLAMNEAVNALKACTFEYPVDTIRFMHAYIRKTRGVVATVIIADLEKNTFNVAGVGNISTKLIGALTSRNLLSYNGIVGHAVPNTMNEQEMSLSEFQQFVLCSDGIKSRWDLAKYPGIQKHDLSLQAAAIYKDFARRTDDMSVVIAKLNPK